MTNPTTTVLLLLCVCCNCLADSPGEPSPHVSVGGRFVFSMVPAKVDPMGNEAEPAFGIVYKQLDDGTLTRFYQTKGWYSHEVFVSFDGRYLIQMGPWNGGQRPRKDDLAFAIHREGQHVRSFSTAELMVDHSQVKTSASHYDWQSSKKTPAFSGSYTFTVSTVDGWTYEIDVTTGNVISKVHGP